MLTQPLMVYLITTQHHFISGEKAETSHEQPVYSKIKECFPKTNMFAWESNSVRGVSISLEGLSVKAE